MKFIFLSILSLSTFLFGCEHLKKHFSSNNDDRDKKIMLKKDTVNTVTMKDTMVIYESVCRGCAYEHSTHFTIDDTAGLVELNYVKTTDNNPDNMNGGSVSKDLVIIPKKTGTTTIKLYTFLRELPESKDSLNFSQYKIEVKN